MKAMKTIDPLQTATTLALISAVKSRPSLYIFDKKQSTQDTDEKRALWNDVATELYGNNFLEMDNVEQISAVQKLRIRWTNLKTCFVRELKKQKDPKFLYGISYKRRPYIYFDELSFLKTEVSKDGANSELDNETNEENNEKETTDRKDDDLEIVSVTKPLRVKERVSVPPKPKKAKISFSPKVTQVLERTREVLQSKTSKTAPLEVEDTQNQINPKSKQASKSYEKRQKVGTVAKTNEIDSTNFALSLVPMLNMLPLDKRIDAQVSILTILKEFCSQVSGESSKVADKDETMIFAIEMKSEPNSDEEML
ncbi:uncharacterized protein LOC113499373 [Trichoplusia ni]|uniref:Uncharacterized protein LOC113499373 n=1 Tax=Trichoplusia ni TaxID=7111 RepID=A0A7E5W4U3_TRINI|nr:uncharacterized protein LOC113499373 [Trichoplusia ni]